MTQIGKLYARFLDGRPLTFAELQRLMEAMGWRLDRMQGSHHIYKHKAVPDLMTVQPDRGGNAKRYQLRASRAMVETYGIEVQ